MKLKQKQKQKIEEVAEKYQLKLVLLFGSRVDGKIHKESDYDVAYLSNRKLSFEEESRLNVAFTGIFPQPRERVDTVDFVGFKAGLGMTRNQANIRTGSRLLPGFYH